jgi:hypothetical protein
MRYIWLLGIILLAACSGEQPNPDMPKHTPIAFSANQQEEEVTRAGSTPLESYTSSFRVWGFKSMSYDNTNGYGSTQTVMDQYHVQWVTNTANTSTTNTNDWDYILTTYPDQTPKYWDFEAKAYRFFGSAEMSATLGTWTRTTEEGIDVYKYECNIDATNAADAPFYTHLWFSTGVATDYPTRQFGQPVTLEFIRPFAEVQFKFTAPGVVPEPMLEQPDFRPLDSEKRIALMGKVTITYPISGIKVQDTWNSTPEYSKYLTSFTKPSTATPYWYTVFPITSQGAYKLTVTVNGVEKDCTVPAQYMNWSPGYRYTYIFKVNDEGGVELQTVNIAVKNWQTDDDTTAQYNLYNW